MAKLRSITEGYGTFAYDLQDTDAAAECSGEAVRRISEKQRIKVESVLDKAVEYDKIFLFRSKYLNI